VGPEIACAAKNMPEGLPSGQPTSERKLNILYLSQYFYPEQFLNNHIAKGLAKAGHRVDVVSCVPNYPVGRFFDGYSNTRRKEEEWEGVHVHRVFTIPRGRSPFQLIANYLAYPPAASLRVARLIKARRYDASFVSMPSPLFQAIAGIFAKRIFGVPTIYWVQDIWPDSAIITLNIKNRLVVRLLNLFCGWIYRQADLVMVQSDGFHNKIAGYGVKPARIVTLPNSAPDSFKPVRADAIPERIRALVPDGRRTLMFAGNIGESQDFDTIIAAAHLLSSESDLIIVVIGSGRDEQRIKDKVRREGLGERFCFLGRHPEEDMPAFFACADAMLVSLRNVPIFALTIPSKVQAYLACGKPILASLAGEGAQIIEESGAGLVAPPASPHKLAETMEEFMSIDKKGLDEMAERALATYQSSFSIDSILKRLQVEIGRVIKS